MAIANFIPTIWSQLLLDKLNPALVLGNLANREYQGEVLAFGNKVKINTPGRIAAVPHAKGDTIAYNYPASTQQELDIDQRTIASFKTDDLDQIQANVDLNSTYVNEVAFALADDIDFSIAALYTAAAAGDVALNVSSTIAAGSVLTAIATAERNLNVNNVPKQGRWLAVSPHFTAAIPQDTRITQATDMGDNVVTQGASFLGRLGGFNLFETNNLTGTGVDVELTAAANIAATSIAVTALSAAIPAGTILRFGGGQYVRTTADANSAAESIAVEALDFPLASGAEAVYVTVRKCLYGYMGSITMALQKTPMVEALRDKDTTDDYFRAEQAYGRRVVRPRSLGTLSLTEV